MNKPLIPLLLCMVLLCGCASQNSPAETEESPLPAATAESIPSLNVPFLDVLQNEGAVIRHSCQVDLHGMLALEKGLLFLSGEDATTLTLADPDTFDILAVHEISFPLRRENSTLQILDMGLSYFDSAAMETVVLDQTLREIRRIDAPGGMTGMPLLSKDGRTLYYCTASAIRALDLDTGLSRVLKEAAYPVQSISGILLDDTVLQVSITEDTGAWQTLFLSAETGQLLQSAEGNVLPQTDKQNYFLCDETLSLFAGHADNDPMVFHPLHSDVGCWYLPVSNQAVSCGLTENGTILECYDLDAGQRTAELILDGFLFPDQLTQTSDGSIWFLVPGDENQIIFRWDPAASPVQDGASYLRPRFTRENPDYDGLAACMLYARELSETYGIEILVYKDAAANEPWDYHLEYEYQANVLQRELEALDARLAVFPDGFLKTLRSKFTGLKICIVRSTVGSPESGSLEAVNGIQFMDGFDAYIVLSTDHNTEYTLYHELSHLMETVVLTQSTAYDRWDLLNPEGFSYDNDYQANLRRDGSRWLQSGREYFIDTYSMSYPKEDRARLLEYAMTAGHEELFLSPNLQRKLRQMCVGIREAFHLEDTAESFLWEQYLLEK